MRSVQVLFCSMAVLFDTLSVLLHIMSSIRILSDRVANQIAAGEVIERPVAVVKELVENSLDAGATRIEIEFRNGGKSYIRIEDNGRGMTPDEAQLCLQRHATSKMREAADLNEIASFGFRGEALPSIASVSKFTLCTRSKDQDYGTEILINGGQRIEIKDCGMPIGTVIEVAQLFNSVPARRKFLKTDATETAHITYHCRLFAVAHPTVAFRVLENGRTVFQSPVCNRLQDRIAEIWGRSLADDLIPVDFSDPKTRLRLFGLTAKPGIGRATRRELVTLVNRRPVDSRTLSLAVLDAYHGRIQKGRYPPAFLFLEIQPQEVDVNVHPAKREVRFRDEGVIRRFVLKAVTETLVASRANDIAQTIAPVIASETKPLRDLCLAVPKPSVLRDPSDSSATVSDSGKDGHIASRNTPLQLVGGSVLPDSVLTPACKPVPGSLAQSSQTESVGSPAAQGSSPGWRLITVLKKRYALFDTARGLVMLHLRHADQRVRYERIRKAFQQDKQPSQGLLIPQPIEFEPIAAETLNTELKHLNAQGFAIEAFGRNFYRIEAVPTWLSSDQAEAFIRDLVDLARQRGGARKHGMLDADAIARLAVAGSYRRNETLTASAVEQLIKDLLACETPHTSPFGKPTFSEISWSEWEQRFGDR